MLQATIFGSRRICSYDLNGEETTEVIKQEGAAYPYQQTKIDLCGSFKIGCEREHYLV